MEITQPGYKKRRIPPFSELPRTPADFSPDVFKVSPHRLSATGNTLLASPYTAFIPLSYVLSSNVINYNFGNYSQRYCEQVSLGLLGTPNEHARVQQIMQTPLRNLFWSTYQTGNGCREEAIRQLRKELFFDLPRSLASVENSHIYTMELDVVGNYFKKMTDFTPFRTRSYQGMVGPLTLFRRERGNYIPHVLAVVLPENYAYQKLFILKHGRPDLEKVVVLVDRMLDSTDFVSSPFRELYRSRLEPHLKTLPGTVFKVPLDFIQQQCFMPLFQLESTNLLQRRNEVQELVRRFYDSYRQQEEIPVTVDSPITPPYQELSSLGIEVEESPESIDFRTSLMAATSSWVVENRNRPVNLLSDYIGYNSHLQESLQRHYDELVRTARPSTTIGNLTGTLSAPDNNDSFNWTVPDRFSYVGWIDPVSSSEGVQGGILNRAQWNAAQTYHQRDLDLVAIRREVERLQQLQVTLSAIAPEGTSVTLSIAEAATSSAVTLVEAPAPPERWRSLDYTTYLEADFAY